jgi:N-hydroxyarylamine O-acetyltransferase
MQNQAILKSYLSRLGLGKTPDLDVAGLDALQRAHRLSIGFANLDVMLGHPIRIDLDSIADKLISRQRGGYCFEHNALFGAMLAELGFANRPLLGRVWLGSDWPGEPATTPPQTHTLRLTTIAGAPWIADAGFGGAYVPPLPLSDGAQAATPDGALHRLRRVGAEGAATANGCWSAPDPPVPPTAGRRPTTLSSRNTASLWPRSCRSIWSCPTTGLSPARGRGSPVTVWCPSCCRMVLLRSMGGG